MNYVFVWSSFLKWGNNAKGQIYSILNTLWATELETLSRSKSDASIIGKDQAGELCWCPLQGKTYHSSWTVFGFAVWFLCIPLNHEIRLLPCMINMFGLSITCISFGKNADFLMWRIVFHHTVNLRLPQTLIVHMKVYNTHNWQADYCHSSLFVRNL